MAWSHGHILEVRDEGHGATELVYFVLGYLQDLPVLILLKVTRNVTFHVLKHRIMLYCYIVAGTCKKPRLPVKVFGANPF